jgi:hypothetical protein
VVIGQGQGGTVEMLLRRPTFPAARLAPGAKKFGRVAAKTLMVSRSGGRMPCHSVLLAAANLALDIPLSLDPAVQGPPGDAVVHRDGPGQELPQLRLRPHLRHQLRGRELLELP